MAPAACPASNLTTTNYTGSLAVPANGTTTQSVPISLVGTAPDSCQNVSFALKYTGVAQYTKVYATSTVLTSSKAPSTVDELSSSPQPSTAARRRHHPAGDGTVTFYDGTAVVGTANLDGNGKARFLTSHLTVGTKSIKATYNGGQLRRQFVRRLLAAGEGPRSKCGAERSVAARLDCPRPG